MRFKTSFRIWVFVLLAALALNVARVLPTSAQTTYTPSSNSDLYFEVADSVCGELTIKYHNGTDYAFAYEYKVDDQEPTGSHPVVTGDGFYTVVNVNGSAGIHESESTITFDEDSGSHTVYVRLKLGAESDWYFDWVQIEVPAEHTDCLPPPPPGDTICEVTESLVTPYMLGDWVISNEYQSMFNSKFIFTPEGLQVTNNENLARTRALKVVNKPLAEIDSLSFVRTDTMSYQLVAYNFADDPVDLNDPNAVADAIENKLRTLIWEETYQGGLGVFDGYWWTPGNSMTSVPRGVNSAALYEDRHQVDLAEILEANPGLVIYQFGVSYGSYQIGTSVLDSIEFDCAVEDFVAEPLACEDIAEPIVATFSNRQGWELDDPSFATRADGYYEFVTAGLLMHTTNNPAQSTDKVAGYRPVNFHLKDIGAPGDLELVYSAIDGYPSAPPAGLQIRIDLDNNGSIDGFMAYEPAYYGEDWWSTTINTTDFPGLPSDGYPVQGTVWEILDAYPDAHVLAIGFSLGSQVFGGGILETMTIGCQEYKFYPDEVTPEAPTFNEPTCSNQNASIATPNNDFIYFVSGDVSPGGTVEVSAALKPEVKNKVAVGTTNWEYTFSTIEYLNCPEVVVPEDPTVTKIPENTCGVQGSVVPAETDGITYVVNPENPIEGLVEVTAIAGEGKVLSDPDWKFVVYLGDFEACVNPVELTAAAPVFVEQTCELDAAVQTQETDFVRFEVEGTVAPGETVTVRAMLRDSVDPNSYTLTGQTEWTHTFAGSPDCTVDPTVVTTTAPIFIEQTCSVNADVIVDNDDFIRYPLQGNVAPGNSVTVTAVLRESVDPNSYTLTGQTEWTHTFASAPDCSLPQPQVVTPTLASFVSIPVDACEVEGSVTPPADTDEIDYSLVPENPTRGTAILFAEAKEGYVLPSDYAPQVINLGEYRDCEEPEVPLNEITAPEPTFTEATCANPVVAVQIPGSDKVKYDILGTARPGKTVLVVANEINPEVDVIVGDRMWLHEFKSLQDLNCEVPQELKFIYLPSVAK